MIHQQNTKVAILLTPQSVGTDAVSGVVDTAGYDHAELIWLLDPAAASNLPTTLNVYEYDSTSSTALISALNPIDTDNGYSLAAPGTGASQILINDLDLRGRKRYLGVNLCSTAARDAAVIAVLSRAEDGPNTKSARGATEWTVGLTEKS